MNYLFQRCSTRDATGCWPGLFAMVERGDGVALDLAGGGSVLALDGTADFALPGLAAFCARATLAVASLRIK